jgi:hypothetical protein
LKAPDVVAAASALHLQYGKIAASLRGLTGQRQVPGPNQLTQTMKTSLARDEAECSDLARHAASNQDTGLGAAVKNSERKDLKRRGRRPVQTSRIRAMVAAAVAVAPCESNA